MTQIISNGPGARARRTKVSRVPFWKPAEGEWIFLPVDKAHNQQIMEEDELGESLGSIGLYESKGWRHIRNMTDDAKAMAKLPENWREVAGFNAEPVFVKAAPKPKADPVPAAKGDGAEF